MNTLIQLLDDYRYTKKPSQTKHRAKKFKLGDFTYTLSKHLNGAGGVYHLWMNGKNIHAVTVTVNDSKYWGEGLTWVQAERKMEKRILGLHRLREKIKESYQ